MTGEGISPIVQVAKVNDHAVSMPKVPFGKARQITVEGLDGPEGAVKETPELEKDLSNKAITLAGGDESFTFAGHGFVRVTALLHAESHVSPTRCNLSS